MAKTRKPSATDPEQTLLEAERITPSVIRSVGIGVDDLASIYLLETIRGFGPQKFKELHEARVRPSEVLLEPQLLPTRGKRGDAFRAAISGLDPSARELAHARAVRQITRAQEHTARIVSYADPDYPGMVYRSNNPIPVLYLLGDARLYSDSPNAPPAVACVGSRDIKSPYADLHGEFAAHAARSGHVVVSGFATGADTIGHQAAHSVGGKTLLVMPCGLDRPFPPENRELWVELLAYNKAAMVSEFPFGTAAAALTLRKRNKLIVAFAAGVLLSQSSRRGGAMNAYRFALEQHKPVATFADDGAEATSGNQLIAAAGTSRQEPLEPLARGASPSATVFRSDRPDPQAWEKWLSRLSFLT